MPNIQKIVVSGSAISQLNNDLGYALGTAVSGTFALQSAVSGAFTEASSAFSTRITTLEVNGPTNAQTASFVNSNDVEFLAVSGQNQTLTSVSSSIGTRLTALEAPQTASFVSSDNVKFAVNNDGSASLQTLTSVSSSVSVRFTTLETDLNALEAKSLVSSSAQIATDISGAFTAVSGGLAGRITTLETAGGLTFSSSIAGRVTTLEGTGTIQGVGTTNDVTFNSVTTTADLTVGGNLYVNGTTTAINSDNLNIEDKFILLNSGSAGSPSYEGGIIVESGSVAGTGNAFYYDASDNRWALKKGLSAGNSSAVTADAFMGIVLVSAIGSVDTGSSYYKPGTIIVDDQEIYIVTE
jgi:hypothetical protein